MLFYILKLEYKIIINFDVSRIKLKLFNFFKFPSHDVSPLFLAILLQNDQTISRIHISNKSNNFYVMEIEFNVIERVLSSVINIKCVYLCVYLCICKYKFYITLLYLKPYADARSTRQRLQRRLHRRREIR